MAKPLNIAHRGGALLWPENTLFAFVSAAGSGFDGAELDIQLTRDGKLVAVHDFRLKPELCRDSRGRWLSRRRALPLIRDLTLAEIKMLDVGRPKPGTLYARRHKKLMARDGEPMPTLGEIIAGVRAAKEDFRLFIEIKTSAEDRSLSAPPEAVAEAVVAELRATRFLQQAVLVGFDWRALIHARALAPDLECWFTTERGSRIGAGPIQAAGGKGWFCPLNRVSAAAVRNARARGLAFGVWTVNEARDMGALIGLGVDAICTDRPDRLQAVLGYSPSNSAVER